jgi:hypothetical protein
VTERAEPAVERGAPILDVRGRRLGTVDATFVDYVLVRTPGLMPIDLYIPTAELTSGESAPHAVSVTRDEAMERWHRPLKRAPHAEER